MIVVGEGELNKYRLVKRIYEYFLDSATKESYEYFSKHKDLKTSHIKADQGIIKFIPNISESLISGKNEVLSESDSLHQRFLQKH